MELTFKYQGTEIDVEFDYQPAERPVYYTRNGDGYPGCGEEFVLTAVKHCGEDISAMTESMWEEIEEAAYEYFTNNTNDYGDEADYRYQLRKDEGL